MRFMAVIEVIPGNKSTRVNKLFESESLADAWVQAIAGWREFGPSSYVVSVDEKPAIIKDGQY